VTAQEVRAIYPLPRSRPSRRPSLRLWPVSSPTCPSCAAWRGPHHLAGLFQHRPDLQWARRCGQPVDQEHTRAAPTD